MKDNIDWPDIRLCDLESIVELDKKNLYCAKIKTFETIVIRSLYNFICKESDFHFSKSKDEMTCRMMISELLSHFENGITKKRMLEIVQMEKKNGNKCVGIKVCS